MNQINSNRESFTSFSEYPCARSSSERFWRLIFFVFLSEKNLFPKLNTLIQILNTHMVNLGSTSSERQLMTIQLQHIQAKQFDRTVNSHSDLGILYKNEEWKKFISVRKQREMMERNIWMKSRLLRWKSSFMSLKYNFLNFKV